MPSDLFGSAEAGRFLRRVAAVTGLLVGIAVGLNAWALFFARDPDGTGLVPYQRAKIAALVKPDLVLVGDSTLGNGIDRRMLDEIAGVTSANLALNGLFGFAGDLNMLATVAPADLPSRVVVMHTSDMLTRPPSDLGDVVSSPARGIDLSSPRSREMIGAAVRFIWRVPDAAAFRRVLGGTARMFDPDVDYVRQVRRVRCPKPEKPRLSVPDIRADKVLEMRALARWCADRGIEAWYAHGPMAASVVEASGEYYDEVNRLLAEAGFRVVAPRPLGLHPEATGDTEDHVRPEFRAASTRWYAERLMAAWRGEAPSMGSGPASLGDPAAPYRREDARGATGR